MAEAKQGDMVTVNYTGKLDDGEVFDSSEGREPLEFTIGASEVIPGFEQAVVGMQPGESKQATIPARLAYGSHEQAKVLELGRDKFPAGLDLKLGQNLSFRDDKDQVLRFTVTSLSDSAVTIDGNHPLAGKELLFEIELVAIAAGQA